jgi:L-2,4-diaminobutyrate decarboxylase
MKELQQIQRLFPSEDGNKNSQEYFLSLIEMLVKNIDSLKNPNQTMLGKLKEKTDDYYESIIKNSETPSKGISLEEVVDTLVNLSDGHPYQTKNYVTNAIPMASIPGLLGSLTASLLNSNSLWDVYGPAAGEAEVKIIAMMSKLVGYDEKTSWGYTTWGGQGAVFTSLRLAIAKQFPRAKEEGIPNNLYCFASENAHYSLLKSVEATGIGSNNLITVRANPHDHAMDIQDLHEKMEQVILQGGIPIYIAATTGATDSFGIDDVQAIKEIADQLTEKYKLNPVYIHADSAMGGMYCVFNEYDFEKNSLFFEAEVKQGLIQIREKIKHLHLADSVCFDFHKLGQTPYISNLILTKNGEDFKLLDLQEFETPYVGNRGYGSYHTSYTLECTRMGSAISIYATLLAFGIEGYQQLLANYVRVNCAFRDKLVANFPNVAVTNNNNPGPATAFRFYKGLSKWQEECDGRMSSTEIDETNKWNSLIFEQIGAQRDKVFFGDTTRHCLVDVVDKEETAPISVVKFFSISPYTTVETLDTFIHFLQEQVQQVEENEGVLMNV